MAITISVTTVDNTGSSVASLTQSGIAALLTSSNFLANNAATFTFGTDTYLAINDVSAGFSASTDAIINITGFSGTLTTANFTII